MREPLVTVAMPVYNGEQTLARAIQSALGQDWKNLEVLVIDDGSTDRSLDIIQSFSDPRIRIVVHASNRGLAATRNHLVDETRGEFIMWLDQDDTSHPARARLQLGAFLANPRLGICGAWAEVHSASRITNRRSRAVRRTFERLTGMSETIRSALAFRNVFVTSTTMVRRASIRERNLRFDETNAPAEDYEFWARVAFRCDAAVLPIVLGTIWELPSGASVQGRTRQIQGAKRVREEYLANAGIRWSSRDLEAHANACASLEDPITRDELRDVIVWLEELCEWNRKTCVFDERSFDDAAAERLAVSTIRCMRDDSGGIRLLGSSKLARRIPVTATRRLSQALETRKSISVAENSATQSG